MKLFTLSLVMSIICLWILPFVSIVSTANPSHINTLFLSGLILLLVGATTFVIRSGFLNLFFKGFIKIRETLIRQPAFMKEVNENIQKDSTFTQWKEKVTRHLMGFAFGAGLGMAIISTIWAYSY